MGVQVNEHEVLDHLQQAHELPAQVHERKDQLK
jgi:hypothetical protein